MHRTQGVVLKKHDIGEVDATVVMYTRDYGKTRAFAQGIKKEGAKLKGHLEPYSLSEVRFVLGKTGERLTHAELVKFGEEMRTDFSKIQAASFIVGAYDRHCMEGEMDGRLWELLVGTLTDLEGIKGPEIKNFLVGFEKKFFEILGFSATEHPESQLFPETS